MLEDMFPLWRRFESHLAKATLSHRIHVSKKEVKSSMCVLCSSFQSRIYPFPLHCTRSLGVMKPRSLPLLLSLLPCFLPCNAFIEQNTPFEVNRLSDHWDLPEDAQKLPSASSRENVGKNANGHAHGSIPPPVRPGSPSAFNHEHHGVLDVSDVAADRAHSKGHPSPWSPVSSNDESSQGSLYALHSKRPTAEPLFIGPTRHDLTDKVMRVPGRNYPGNWHYYPPIHYPKGTPKKDIAAIFDAAHREPYISPHPNHVGRKRTRGDPEADPPDEHRGKKSARNELDPLTHKKHDTKDEGCVS